MHNLTRSQLHKLLNFAAKESHFVFDGVIYDQVDGVAMGSPLGPVLANVFMCHLETMALDNYSGIKPLFYKRYVDDTFLIFHDQTDMEAFFNWFNIQHPSISFTKEEEDNNSLPFLDVLVTRRQDNTLSASLYRKPTFSGLYLKFDSFVPRNFKRGLVTCLVNRAWRICSTYELFHLELDFIRKTLNANGYPTNFIESCVHRFLSSKFSENSLPVVGPEKKSVYLCLPFCGDSSLKLKRQLVRIYRAVAPWISITVVFQPINKLASLSRLKEPVPILKRSNVVYQVNCSDCNAFYIGMTTRRLHQRLSEHASQSASALYRHASETGHSLQYDEPNILAMDSVRSKLLIKESLKIKELCAYKSLNGNSGSFELYLW